MKLVSKGAMGFKWFLKSFESSFYLPWAYFYVKYDLLINLFILASFLPQKEKKKKQIRK